MIPGSQEKIEIGDVQNRVRGTELRVRSVNSLGFTAGMQKFNGSDPLVFLRPSGFKKIQPTGKSIG